MELDKFVKPVPNFPKEGILFRDISPLLNDVQAREESFTQMAKPFFNKNIDVVVGLESRGFIFGIAIASKLKVPFVMIRKPNKLPGNKISVNYEYEYSSGTFEVGTGLINPKQNVLLVDDVLATGGSAKAVVDLIKLCGATVVGASFLVELQELNGRKMLHDTFVFSAIVFNKETLIDMKDKETNYVEIKRDLQQFKRIVLMYHPSCETIAKELIQMYPEDFIESKINWQRFPDSYPNITFDAEILKNKRVVFLGSLYNQEQFIEQISMTMVLPRQLVKSLDIVLPYFAPGTMERVEKEGVLATAETMAKMISAPIPSSRSGPPILRIYDMHATPVRFYFTDNIVVKMQSNIESVLQHMKLLAGNFIVAFPDEGAFKRFRTSIPDHIPIIVCSKHRDGDKRVVKIVDKINFSKWYESPSNHVLIMDDLVQTGGTLYECYLALKKEGYQYISASVTHAIFPNRCYKRFLENGDRTGFLAFFISNSVPEVVNELRNRNPFKVISIVPNLGGEIISTYNTKDQQNSSKVFVNIHVASKTSEKIQASMLAASNRFGAYAISSYTGNSNVSNQPVGLEEIMLGARNRIESFKKFEKLDEKIKNIHIFLGIENGIVKDANNEYFDIACVIVKIVDNENFVIGEEIQTWSKAVYPPKEAVKIFEDTLSKHKKSETVGAILFYMKQWTPSNWHFDATGINRSYYLYEAISNAFNQIQFVNS